MIRGAQHVSADIYIRALDDEASRLYPEVVYSFLSAFPSEEDFAMMEEYGYESTKGDSQGS